MFDDCYLRLGSGPVKGCLPLSAPLLASLYALPHRAAPDLVGVLGRRLVDAPEDGTQIWPWEESLRVAPVETARAVAGALEALMLATPDLDPARIDPCALPEGSRARLHFTALVRLWQTSPEVMPSDLAILRDFLACDPGDALQGAELILGAGSGTRGALEQAVLDKLAATFASVGKDDPDYLRLIGERMACAAPADTLAGHVQRHFLTPGVAPVPRDETVCFLSVRDALGEAEAAVAIAQRWLREDETLTPADIAIIVPEGSAHAGQIATLAGEGGLVVSRVPSSAAARNIGAETVNLLLVALRDPAPAMARASLLASPILPWPQGAGARMARRLMQGRGRLDAGIALDEAGQELLRLCVSGTARTNRQLKGQLLAFRKLLGRYDARTDADKGEARGHVMRLVKALGAADEDAAPDWPALTRVASAYRVERAPRGRFYAGGLSVLHAAEKPRRQFRKLFVLGFNEGLYPAPAPRSALFLDSELDAIAEACGLRLVTRRTALDLSLAHFVRQLGAASEAIVFLSSERDGYGKALLPASSLALMARLVEGVETPEDLVEPVSRAGASQWDRLIDWQQGPGLEVKARMPVPEHFALGMDLLHLRVDEEGNPRPQSPSRLETLLVSPLAWVLEEMDAGAVSWVPETLDVRLRGTIAHGVFEMLFPAGEALPQASAIAARVPALMARAIADEAPFLAGAAWAMEREVLQAEIEKAARNWCTVMTGLGAEVVANEFWLEGEILGHPVHGKADSLLRLPDGQPVIVDHKKSSSGTRRKRMEAGCDLQVEIYRRLQVKIGKDDNAEPSAARTVLNGAESRPGVAYHMMNDAGVLVHGVDGVGTGAGTGGVELFDSDISERAMAELGRRFVALRNGLVETNSSADEAHFRKKTALGTYAFDDSPLVRAHMREADQPSAFVIEDEDD